MQTADRYAQRPKPKPGETWLYITGQEFRILRLEQNTDTQKEYVVYSDARNPESMWHMPLDEFMATLGDGDDTKICYFQKVRD
ncbi:DUF1653 domain-containing protein [Leptolyngbya iicbica LK]|uniref:DUF1653 domain-containing protein n=1 Tax=Leptolyngbya iicbica LK TaxID=2294035 RepID=A0A4Q7E0P9_9CYAN|nr:DUF1653 domain-containing protein [Leptolyngbya sp. LK]RZM74088.1 DUF1653 domain-containing protein [Leptolyngbya sp. LK]